MNVRTEPVNPSPFEDFVIGVDEWDFHYTEDGIWHVHLEPDGSENFYQFGKWSAGSSRRQPTDEQFNFARSFLSLTQ